MIRLTKYSAIQFFLASLAAQQVIHFSPSSPSCTVLASQSDSISTFWNSCQQCEAISTDWFCVTVGANFTSGSYGCFPQTYSNENYHCSYISNSNTACCGLYCTQLLSESECNSATYDGGICTCVWDSSSNSCSTPLAEAVSSLIKWIFIWIAVCCVGSCLIGGLLMLGLPACAVAIAGLMGCCLPKSKQKSKETETVTIIYTGQGGQPASPYTQMPPNEQLYPQTGITNQGYNNQF